MRTSLLVVALAGSGCTVDMTEPSTSSTEQFAKTHNRLAANRLAANRLAANRLAANRLAANSLNGLVALSDTSQILLTEGGREVYSYLTSCALPEDVVIHATIPGATDTPDDANWKCVGGECEFYGGLGLVPEWLDKRLNPAGQGWISACLFARSNEHDTAAAISLRGRNPALSVTSDEAAIYSVEEGAFYGNVFIDDPDETHPPDWHACMGEGQAAGEYGGLVLRDCTEEDPNNLGFTVCGFKYDGFCRDFTPDFPSPSACGDNYSGGAYTLCNGTSDKNHKKKYRQVITSYVTST